MPLSNACCSVCSIKQVVVSSRTFEFPWASSECYLIEEARKAKKQAVASFMTTSIILYPHPRAHSRRLLFTSFFFTTCATPPIPCCVFDPEKSTTAESGRARQALSLPVVSSSITEGSERGFSLRGGSIYTKGVCCCALSSHHLATMSWLESDKSWALRSGRMRRFGAEHAMKPVRWPHQWVSMVVCQVATTGVGDESWRGEPLR